MKDPKARWADKMTAVWAIGRASLTSDQKEASAATIGWYIQNHPMTPVSLLDPPGRAFFHGLSTLVILWFVLFRMNQVVGMVIPMLITVWGLALYVSGAQSREIELASAAVRAVVTTGSPNVLKPILNLHKQAGSLRLLRGAREVRDGIRMGLAATLEEIGNCEVGGVTSDTIPLLASLLKSRILMSLGLRWLRCGR